MGNNIIIKLFRPQIGCADFRDLELDNFEQKVNDLRQYAKSIGKHVLFSVCEESDCADFDCFAEIKYDGELSDSEKLFYIDVIKFFARDAEVKNGHLDVYALPLNIAFTKSQIETVSLE